MADRQAELHGEQAGGEVSEISGGNDESGKRAFGELSGTMDVVERLGYEAGEVDGVCRGEVHALREITVKEGLFDERLAIVERAIDFEGGDVSAESGELFFLESGDFALGVEDDDACSRDVVEGRGDGTAGIAGGGDEDGEHAVVIFGEMGHEACHEASAEVFEGEGGAVEELEDVILGREGDEGCVELECSVDDFVEVIFRDVFAEEGVGDGEADFLEGEVAVVFPEVGAESGKLVRHVEAVVRRE